MRRVAVRGSGEGTPRGDGGNAGKCRATAISATSRAAASAPGAAIGTPEASALARLLAALERATVDGRKRRGAAHAPSPTSPWRLA
ncbi:MAG TPA: hypothetical protein VEF90_08110, partial [Xanthobacteraceae bacterium]|nr:hypothetical protein [Xanthobacteraceae bacterium]